MATCPVAFNGRRCGRWDCVGCGPLREGDQRGVLLSNLTEYGGDTWMLTVTAPGDDVLPRDHDGRCELDALAHWCDSRGKRWRSLRNSAVRSCGRRSPVLATVWQPQPGRGAPHAHCVIRATDSGYAYALAMDRLSASHGFGFVDLARDPHWRDRQPKSWAGYRAAWYLSRYLAVGVRPWSYPQWQALMPHVHRVRLHPELTRRTQDTLRNRRMRRQYHMWKVADGRMPRFDSERHMIVIARQYRGRPLGDLSKFDDTPYDDLRSSLERESFAAVMQHARDSAPRSRDDNQLKFLLTESRE